MIGSTTNSRSPTSPNFLPVVRAHDALSDLPPLVDEDPAAPLYQLAVEDTIAGLLREHALARRRIGHLKALLDGGLGDAVRYFIEGNAGDKRLHRTLYIEKLFRLPRALKALDAEYWRRALSELDIWETLPQARRDQWRRHLDDWRKSDAPDAGVEVPPFAAGTVRSTLSQLLALRAAFLAERVDGIFARLSRTHSTNAAERFGQRMIVAGALDSNGCVCLSTAGHIHDLRGVIAKFMGDAEPTHSETLTAIEAAKEQWGEWLILDGGALSIRVYRAGTLHLRVHPDLCWRLNALLAIANPKALPGPRTWPGPQGAEDDTPLVRPLPFAVRYLIAHASVAGDGHAVCVQALFERDRPALGPAYHVLEMMGGVARGDTGRYEFAVDVAGILRAVGLSGCIELDFAGQFAQTPDDLAGQVIELAQVGPHDTCLEPSAGAGRIARKLPPGRTTCVELHDFYGKDLRALGCEVHRQDFLTWAQWQEHRYSRIVMFPPAGQGDWLHHLGAALLLLAPGGRLVAILPAAARPLAGDHLPPDCAAEWIPVARSHFPGTALDLVIAAIDRAA